MPQVPASEGTGYGSNSIEAAGETQAIIPVGVESGSYMVRADKDNTAEIYFGWDEEVTVDNGMYLEKGEYVTVDMDNSAQSIYMVGEEVGDSVRWIALE